jgi:3-dehydroquinate synthetase
MERVKVDLEGAPYDILIGEGLIDGAAQHLSSFARSGRFLLVTDSDVAAHVLPRFSAAPEVARNARQDAEPLLPH